MPSICKVQIVFDGADCSLQTASGAFSLRDHAGNEVTLQLREILRCLSIAEHKGLVTGLTPEFWTSAEQYK